MKQKHPSTHPWGKRSPGRMVGSCDAWGVSCLICLQKASSRLPLGVWSSAPWLNIIRLGVLHDSAAPGVWVGERSPGPAGVVGFYGERQPARCQTLLSTAPRHIHLRLQLAHTRVSSAPTDLNKNPLFVANHSIQGWKVHGTKNIPS